MIVREGWWSVGGGGWTNPLACVSSKGGVMVDGHHCKGDCRFG